MDKLLSRFPKPLLDDIAAGRCLPVIGAGFSKNAVLPFGKQMPLWDDLGKSLSSEISGYSYSGALDAISAYAHEFSRAKLIERLYESLLIHEAQPGGAHRAFCELPFDLAVTTNLEFLLEEAYLAVNRPCRPLVDEDQLSVESDTPHVKLLKLHGDVNHPNRLVVTEEDYDAFLDSYPLLATFLASLLISRTPLLIGYSLDDPDFRQLWQIVGSRLGRLRRTAYALGVGISSQAAARYERRGVKVINLPGKVSDYSKTLEQLFYELREYWSSAVLKHSRTTDEGSLSEFSLPPNSTSRLCFFAVPSEIISFYKEVVFPMAERVGLTPIAAIDVVAAGDNILAKVSALIDRAEVFVVDASSVSTRFELGMVIKSQGKRNILVIGDDPVLPLDSVEFLSRPQDPWADRDQGFEKKIQRWLEDVSESLKPRFDQEPRRLLAVREYRAAVVSAITLLETELRERIMEEGKVKPSGVTLRRVVSSAASSGLLAPKTLDRVREWIRTRHDVVHSTNQVAAKKATSIVEGVYDILQELRSAS